MRPLLTIMMVTLLIGGMWAYVKFKDSVSRPRAVVKVEYSKKPTRLVVLRSASLFDGGGLGGPAVEVSIKSRQVLKLERTVSAEEVIEVDLPDVEVGKNTVYVAVNFEDPDAFLSDQKPLSLYAMEAVILQGSRQLHRQTFTSTEPFIVGGDILFEVPPTRKLIGDSGASAPSHDTHPGAHH